MRAGLEHLYELMAVLKHYCTVNATGFRKIVKKWDKVTGEAQLSPFVENVLARQSFAAAAELCNRMAEAEALFAAAFMDDDAARAKTYLGLYHVHVRLQSGHEKSVFHLIKILIRMFKDGVSELKARDAGHKDK